MGTLSESQFAPGRASEPVLGDVATFLSNTEADASRGGGGQAVGSRLGRYLVIERIGAGAMGIVYAAYDPKLNRKVALKVLAGGAAKERARLEREAQALAQLAHPNVVAVYDVDVHEGQLFVAMEFVAGRTFGAWLRAAQRDGAVRTMGELLPPFMAAGEGLAAAHEVGLIHRDFKPENVMLGDDGRARVMDFGLARAEDGGALERSLTDALERTHDLLDPQATASGGLTRTGALLGTPAYMALEQFEGRVDARSDQFAFCVALYEALYGARPFAADDMRGLAEALRAGAVAPPPAQTQVPAWLRAVVVRGLAPEPAARWPSMRALLVALADDPSVALTERRWIRRRRVVGLGFASLIGLSVAGSAAYDEHQRGQARRGCEARARASASVWSEARAAALEQVFLDSGQRVGAESWATARVWIERYAAQLERLRRDNCAAFEVDAVRPARDAELIDACLDDREAWFDVMLDALAETEGPAVHFAAHAAASLAPIEACTDLRLQASVRRPPPELRDAIVELDRGLYRASVLRHLSQVEPARAQSDAVLAEARALGWAPLLAEALLGSAHMNNLDGEADAALELAEAAYRRAAVDGDVHLLAEAALTSAGFRIRTGDHARADEWLELGAELIDEMGPESPYHGYLALERSRLAHSRGELERAEVEARRAIALTEARLGSASIELGRQLSALSNTLYERGAFAASREVAERELQILEDAYGRDSVQTLYAHNAIAVNMHVAGEIEAARAAYVRVAAIAERVYGPEHGSVALSSFNLALIAYEVEEDLDASRVGFERALRVFEVVSGPRSPHLIKPLVNLGTVASREGEHARARELFARCISILAAAQGEQLDRRELFVRSSAADARVRAGELEPARALYERALFVAQQLDGAQGVSSIRPRLGLARVELEGGELDAAQARLEVLAGLIDAEPSRRWVYALARAQLRWARGERAYAVTRVAELRAEQAAKSPPDKPFAVEDLDAWLAAHEGGASHAD